MSTHVRVKWQVSLNVARVGHPHRPKLIRSARLLILLPSSPTLPLLLRLQYHSVFIRAARLWKQKIQAASVDTELSHIGSSRPEWRV